MIGIFESVNNIKDKAILMLTFSAGLRVSEVIKLKTEHIDTKRNMIHIKAAKGRKERYTVLSEVALRVLREYWKTYQPKNWLFIGSEPNSHLTAKTVDKTLEAVSQKAGIAKNVTVYTLRHSFAPHLLEGTTDLWYVQKLPRHKNSKTTRIYTHVSQGDIRRIKNPLDFGEK